MRPSQREIFDALISDSSLEGCDPDWRAEVLEAAGSEDIARVRAVLDHPRRTEGESRHELSREERERK